MKTKDIKDKADADLLREVAEKQKHLFDLRTQAVTDKLEDPTQLGKTRRDIARIKTLIRQRQLAAAKASTPAAAGSTK
jgi:large subunit ribosomal protein L29